MLPPLPETEGYIAEQAAPYEPVHISNREAYSAEQMYAFGHAAVAALVPMTEAQLLTALVQIDPDTKRLPPGFVAFARAIEAHHGIGGAT